MAKIIRVDFPRFGKIWCKERDLRFPQVFRITAFERHMNAQRTELVAADRPVAPTYTLRIDPQWKVHANPTFTAIDAPDAQMDRGYIIVRHHESEAHAQGYQDAVCDFQHLAPDEYEWWHPSTASVRNSSRWCIARSSRRGAPGDHLQHLRLPRRAPATR